MGDDRLRLSANRVKTLTHNLGRQLANILGRAASGYLFDLRQFDGTGFDGRQASFGLNARLRFEGTRGEVFKLEREHGGEALLVPLVGGELPRVRHWLSVSMLWDPAPGRSRKPELIYRSAQVAVYQAIFQAVEALQLIRAEWTGKRIAGQEGVTEFDSGAAGHPHWHVDAVSEIRERLRRHREEQSEQDRFRDQFMRSAAAERQYVDFDDLLETTRFSDNKPLEQELDSTLSSLHLAQCAPWQHQPWDGSVGAVTPQAHNPNDFDELASWISSTVRYLRHEFEKVLGVG